MNWRNLQANAFEALIAVMCLISALTAFINPSSLGDSVVGRELHPWDFAWNFMFGISGILIIIGLSVPLKEWTFFRGRATIEAVACELAGLIFLGTSVFINGAAAISVNRTVAPGLFIFAAVIVACVYRARVITSAKKELVPVEIPATEK
jgi:hypothetical protein